MDNQTTEARGPQFNRSRIWHAVMQLRKPNGYNKYLGFLV